MDDIRHKPQEIYLTDVMWRLLEQWRGLLLTGIVFSILVTGIVYLRNITKEPANNAVNTHEISGAVEIDLEEHYRKLADVLAKYVKYSWLKQDYDTSFWATNDYKESKNVCCTYSFNVNGNESDIYNYSSILSSIAGEDNFRESMINEANKYWKDVNSTSLFQIMNVSVDQDIHQDRLANGALTVTVLLPIEADVAEWERSLNSAIASYCNKIDSISEYNIPKLVMITSSQVDYMGLVNAQNERYTKVMTAQTEYYNASVSLSKDDQELIQQIIEKSDGSYNINDYLDVLNNDLQALNEINMKHENEITIVENGRGSGIKYIVLRFIVGIVIYICIYFVYYISVGAVRNENELYNVTDISNFGGVYEYPYKGRLSIFLHDKKIYNIRTKRGKSIEQISDDIVSRLNHIDSDKLTVISLGNPSKSCSHINEIQYKYLREKQIEFKTENIDYASGNVNESIFEDMGSVLIQIQGNKTKWKDVLRLCSVLNRYDAIIIGSEYLEA